MGAECVCDPDNGKKRDSEFTETLLLKLIEAQGAKQQTAPDSELRQVIFGPEGEIDKGLLGKMHRMDLVLVELQSGQKSMRTWLKVGVTVNLFLLSILTAHLADSPAPALADTAPPPAIEQTTQEDSTDGSETITIR